jgi:hypothetical protein
MDQLRTRIVTNAAEHTQTPVLVITIEEIIKDACWLVRYDNVMRMYVIREGAFCALSEEDMGLAPGSDETADTYIERYAGAVLRSLMENGGDTKIP